MATVLDKPKNFPWKIRTVPQRAEKLLRINKLMQATKANFIDACCLECEDKTIYINDYYYTTTDGTWKGHQSCVKTITEPFHDKAARRANTIMTEFTVPKKDKFMEFEDANEEDETPKYSDDNWECLIDDVPEETFVKMSVTDAAKLYKVNPSTIYRMVERGQLKKEGNKVLIPQDKVPLTSTLLAKHMPEIKPLSVSLAEAGFSKGEVHSWSKPIDSQDNLAVEVAFLKGKVEALENTIENLLKPLLLKLAEGK